MGHRFELSLLFMSLKPSASHGLAAGIRLKLGALVEADIGRYKRVIGDALRSRTEGRQTTEGGHCCRLAKPHARAWPAGVRSPHVNVAARG